METVKLTLKLNALVIQQTKRYARRRQTSLSRMVEGYFRALVGKQPPSSTVTPLVRELSGVASPKAGRGWGKGYAEYLARKYAA